jgi:hypothetical protein
VTVYLILLSAAAISFVPMAIMFLLERREKRQGRRGEDR